MNVLLLPGIQQKTAKWAEGLLAELALPDSTSTVQRYGHWDGDGEQCMMLTAEVARLRGMAVDLLIGKSVGVMVGLLACRQGVLTPQLAVFIGTPVISCSEENFDLFQAADDLAIPALYIQQKDDVVGSSAILCQQIGKASQTTLVEIPGNNHQYKDIKLVARHIRKWLAER